MAWKESDPVTADDLLPEMLEYTTTMLGHFAQAKFTADAHGVKGLTDFDIHFTQDSSLKQFLLKYGNTVVETEAPSVTHPHIVDSFRTVFVRLMEAAGFNHTQGKRFTEKKPNDFSYGGTFSLMSISNFSASCVTTPEEFREALTVKDPEFLKQICRKALEERIAKTAAFKKELEKAGVSLTGTFDPLATVQELHEKGFSTPEIIGAVIDDGETQNPGGKPPALH